ncbi:MAG: SUMF1/EgtB/PvdO family nonheme iron enzyme [Polyangiaceae bacterium]
MVTGTTAATSPPFYRSYDGVTPGYTSVAYPAVVSDFRLDVYEISVGRFKTFVANFVQPTNGSGKNPNDPSDSGWNSTWNTDGSLATSGAALATAVQCFDDQTYTVGIEGLPINCLTWYEAEAFCIWDGGRLPTEAEWNYAASGGTQQRMYPWGLATPDSTFAVYQSSAVAVTGSKSPKGDGLFGQADLGGNLVEWVADRYNSPYSISPCNNCTDNSATMYRGLRSMPYDYIDPTNLLSSYRSGERPIIRETEIGARCARAR